MAIYKRCAHTGKERDRCDDPWYASYQIAGHPRAKVSLAKWTGRDVRTKTDANTAFDELKAEVRAGRFSPAGLSVSRPATPDGAMTFQDLAALFETQYVKGKQLKTADDFPCRVKPLLAIFGPLPLTQITHSRVETWYAARRARAAAEGKSSAWQNRPVGLLRTMLRWAVKHGYLPTDACPSFDIDSEDYSRWRRVSHDEETRLLAAAPPLLRALLVVALDTGMRRGEMLALQVGDVDLVGGVIRLRGATTKSSRTRDLPILSERSRDALAWLQNSAQGLPRPPLAPLALDVTGEPLEDFSHVWMRARLVAYGFTPDYNSERGGWSKQSRKDAKQIDLHWHDLRHEFACRLDDRGVALGKIQRLLGHASIATTDRYLRRGLKDLQTVVLDDGTLPAYTSTGQPSVARSGRPPVVVLDLAQTREEAQSSIEDSQIVSSCLR